MSYSLKSLCSNLIPTGKYKAVVTDMKFAAGGSKSIQVTLTIAEGPYAKRVHIETIPEKAYSFRLMPVLKACKVDVDREFATAEEMYKFAFVACKGKTVMLDMGVRTYNGQEYNNVTDFSPLPDSTVSADEVVASFGENPEVTAPAIADVVEEETNINSDPAESSSEEPSLDIDLDVESPF